MNTPMSPPPVDDSADGDLPAYAANGVVGLRVREIPLHAGMALISGYAGEHAQRRIEAAAVAPYPLAADIQLNGVWLSDAPHRASVVDQAYDFETGELRSRFVFTAGGPTARVEVVTFCSRESPTIVCQEIAIELDKACDLRVRAIVDASQAEGRALRHLRDTPGEAEPACDGVMLWESAGGISTCGIAYVTEFLGAGEIEMERGPMQGERLMTEVGARGRSGRRYRLRQMASLVPKAMHEQPDFQAVRLVALARKQGFDEVRRANRLAWVELWKGRIRLDGAEPRWQALADAAYFYLMSSTHIGSPASTSIFGLATWHDYHYYYGHVMWDIETFVVPVLSLLQPGAADSILDYRFRNLAAAEHNARLRGRRGAQFPWESAPSTGQEAAPMPGSASWHEDHISLDVARAFAVHAHITGELRFLRNKAWPVLAGVADWIVSRVTHGRRGYGFAAAMGIAERVTEADNPAFTNMSAVVVLRAAIQAANSLGQPADPRWRDIADHMAIPMRGSLVVSHDGFRSNEEKGGTPDPLMGIFPLGFDLEPEVRQATLEFYLDLADDYIGSPMLSALYGVWASYAGDRRRSLQLLEDGYGKFCVGRFMQTLEYRSDKFPEQPRAGPFFANLGGFLQGLLLGFTRLEPGDGPVQDWAKAPAQLPFGWEAIEVDRLWIRGQPMRLTARHGELARLEPV